MKEKNLKKLTENDTGLNTSFTNTNTGRTITLPNAIEQIEKGNPTYDPYVVVTKSDGSQYIRSKPDSSKNNNIEQ